MIFFSGADVAVPDHLDQEKMIWIEKCVRVYGKKITLLQYVFCSDNYLYDLNVRFLKHDTFTDIITFDLSDCKDYLHAELYISVERAAENAVKLSQNTENEINRLIIHGVLHLCGFKDKSPIDAAEMRLQEQKCLSLLL